MTIDDEQPEQDLGLHHPGEDGILACPGEKYLDTSGGLQYGGDQDAPKP